ncbi:MAG: 1-deoxy-D-xylulose-5-phosphate synthase, partial [Gammaproteobacteria bacterium]|nr:1-deoxy-D-xylulose-5-phosphate synthase [Gammaproteobacteria bacterium]
VANMRFIKPLDEKLLLELAASHVLLVTLEDNVVMGGAGSAVNESLAAHQKLIPVLNLGLPDRFQDQGSREELLTDAGLESNAIIAAIDAFLDHEPLAKTVTLA